MRSYEQFKPAGTHEADVIAGADAETPRARLAGLVQEHRDLDGAISVLVESGVNDQLLATRLKKRKLQLKDEIARLEKLA